jgi:transposase InsO family protein
MRELGLHGARRGKKIRTTVPGTGGQRAGDLLRRDFTAPAPNRRRVAGFTHVPAWSGVVYVAFVVDVQVRPGTSPTLRPNPRKPAEAGPDPSHILPVAGAAWPRHGCISLGVRAAARVWLVSVSMPDAGPAGPVVLLCRPGALRRAPVTTTM